MFPSIRILNSEGAGSDKDFISYVLPKILQLILMMRTGVLQVFISTPFLVVLFSYPASAMYISFFDYHQSFK